MPDQPRSASQPRGAVRLSEGGWQAWGVVAGSWCAIFGSMSFMNSIGTFQAYLLRHQLSDYSPVAVGWIFGVYNGLTFLVGCQAGPIFDARGPRELIAGGGVLTVVYLMLLGICDQYWHFMLVFGVLGGVSLSLVFGPAIAIVAHYFNERRGLATGIASSGGAVGGIVFPLMLERLFETAGFAWATRAAGCVCIATFGLALVLIRPRFAPGPVNWATVRPSLAIFRQGALTFTSLGVFFLEWGLFVPFSYLASYALDHELSPRFSYMLLSLLNAGGIFGRWVTGYLADRVGRHNMLMVTVVGCFVSLLCLWLPSSSSRAGLVVFALAFGFFSGSGVSLAPVCIGQFCKLSAYGRYYSTAYILVSLRYVRRVAARRLRLFNVVLSALTYVLRLSMFTGTAIGGIMLSFPQNGYLALLLFAAGSYLLSCGCLVISNFTFHDGSTLPSVELAYLDINTTGEKVALIPTCFRGRLQSTLNFSQSALRHHRIIVIALFGNGESSSPSNTANFPRASLDYRDCVRAQHVLLTSHLQIDIIDVILGFSMGGQCTYYWVMMHPDLVQKAVIICSSARTSRHNYQFLEGPKAALEHSVDYEQGTAECPIRGLRAFGKAYSAWLTSAEWFDQELYRAQGFESLAAWDNVVAGTNYYTWDPNDLLAMIGMWQRADISAIERPDTTRSSSLEHALSQIKIPILLMPCQTDQYFRWEASERESRSISRVTLKVIPSVWGHLAGSGANAEDVAWMSRTIADFLDAAADQ
ncbi:sulfotransferase family domain-containing protein [Purpureocillium lavendulum]|uniref:Sulfotransferase family domain-containing protein n=1 Tax=Purpureocillium lavendulum TaxID=1247861 RepID=A0AB34G7A9_9HYPO|nr:sulfotransferase family domain-containing protein [Purpureocillium lavendulum]